MILVTGASGKTGQAIVSKLLDAGKSVRGFSRSSNKIGHLISHKNFTYFQGSFDSSENIGNATDGISAVYHICPNVHPKEFEYGKRIIDAAKRTGIKHFIYHSVIYPQIKSMPHHWNKLLVEEYLIDSNIPFTILQPTAYMENILAQKDNILLDKKYVSPYSTDSQISLIALDDLASVANEIINNPMYYYGIFPLASECHLSGDEIAIALTNLLKNNVYAESILPSIWKAANLNNGLSKFALETLESMFNYYDNNDLISNSFILKSILGKNPINLIQFLLNSSINKL